MEIDNTIGIYLGDTVQFGYISDCCPQNYEEGIVTWVHPYRYYPNGNIKNSEQRVQLEVWCNKKSIITDLENVTIIPNQYQRMNALDIQEQQDINLIVAVAESVRYKMETLYGDGTDLRGCCIDASETIVDQLKKKGIQAMVVEGWCRFDDDFCCTKMPAKPHTWVEIPKYELYVDVMGEQFNLYMEDIYPKVIIHKGGLPSGVSYEKPRWDFEVPKMRDER